MIDRDKRLHVLNVSVKIVNKGKGIEEAQATIYLGHGDEKSDRVGQMDWSVWINGGREALLNGEW